MKFKDLKQWYQANKGNLPITLDAGHIFYNDFRKTFLGYIHIVEHNVKQFGGWNASRMRGVQAAVNNLENMVLHAEYSGKWNVQPKEKIIFQRDTAAKDPGPNHHERNHINILGENDIFVCMKNKSISYSSESTPNECKKSIEFFKKKGYLSQRATF